MKIVSPVASPPSTSTNNYLFPSSITEEQLAYNRSCSSTSTNSSSSSFSNLSCNNGSNLNSSNCSSLGNTVIKKEDSAILDGFYDEMTYQPNYYTNNGNYQPTEGTYLHNNSPSTASYYA